MAPDQGNNVRTRSFENMLICGKHLLRVVEFGSLVVMFYLSTSVISREVWFLSLPLVQFFILITFSMLYLAEQLRTTSRYDKLMFRQVTGQGILTATVLVYFLFNQQLHLCIQSVESKGLDVSQSTDLFQIYTRSVIALSLSTIIIGVFFILQMDISCFSVMVLFSCYFLQDCITDPNIFIPSIAVIIYLVLFWFLNYFCPRSFTIGESATLCQGMTCFLVDFFLFFALKAEVSFLPNIRNLTAVTNRSQGYALVSTLLVSTFLITLLLSPVFYCLARYAKVDKDYIVYSFGFYIGGILNVAAIFLPMAYVVLRINLFTFIASLMNISSILLAIYWLILLALCAAVVVWHTNYNNTDGGRIIPIIIVRKSFHFIAVLIFVPGIYFYPDLMKISSCIAVVLMIILEYVRIFKIYPFGNLIQRYMVSFVDERDKGLVILTHIYLLLGFSIPVWMFPFNSVYSSLYCLVPYAGVISLGFGDAFASILGTLYGIVHLPGSKKTVIGTISCIASQVIASLLLLFLCNSHITLTELISVLICIVFVSAMEAVTTQIDNLILPLVLYGALVLAKQLIQLAC